MLAAALSNNQIKILNHSLTDIQPICSLQGHSDRVTDVSLPIAHSPWLVLSSSEDQRVKLWDTRSSQAAEQYVIYVQILFTFQEQLIFSCLPSVLM